MSTQSLHKLLRYTIVLSKFCALFPVNGALAADSTRIRFAWYSLHMLYLLFVWMGHIFTLCRTWTVVHFREPNGSLSAISNSTLMRCAVPPLVIYPLFLQLSYNWSNFIHSWEEVDARLTLRRLDSRLYRKITCITIILTLMRLVFFAEGYIVTAVRVLQCVDLTSAMDFVDSVFWVRFPQVFIVTKPTLWKYGMLAFLELTSTWSWMCSQLFILNLSLILLDKFKMFNDHLKRFKGKKLSTSHWRDLRRQYLTLSKLTCLTDSLLSPMIFINVTLETMNVTLFIYLGLTHAYSLLSYIYFGIFFLSFMAADTVTLVAVAAIFDESRKPLVILQRLPTSEYKQEVKRFYLQVRRDTVALTGCKFFIVSQTVTLSIISALVTYEVLLVQLGNLKHEGDFSDDTSNNPGYCVWIQNYLKTKT